MHTFTAAARIFFTVILSIASVYANADSQAAGREDKAAVKVDRLRLAGGDYGYPSPFGYVRGPGMMQASYLFDTLIWEDSTGKPIPWLASQWGPSADGKEWRFTLRDGIKWHDGAPLTAEDVAFTFKYMTEGPGRNASVIHARGLRQVVDQVAAESSNVVVFRLRRPFAPFEESIAGRLMILPKHIWESVSDPVKFRDPKALMGSGPYQLKSFDEATGSYLYLANESYFLGVPHVRRLEFVPAPDQLLALQRGSIDAADLLEEGTPEEQIKALSRKFREIKGSGDWNLALHFNLNKGFPYSEIRFREAIVYAIDRKDLVKRLLLGRGEPGSAGGLAPDHPYIANDLPPYERNIKKASALLDEIGLKDKNGDGLRELPDGTAFKQELQISARFTAKSAELIKEYLRRVGIDVVIKVQDRAAADAAAAAGNYTMALVGYGGIMGDPDFLRDRYASTSKARSFSNAQGFKNARFDEIAAKQLVTLDAKERRQMITEMQGILSKELPVISLYVPSRLAFYDPNDFHGWYYTPGCSPCRATRNKHMFVTGKKVGF